MKRKRLFNNPMLVIASDLRLLRFARNDHSFFNAQSHAWTSGVKFGGPFYL